MIARYLVATALAISTVFGAPARATDMPIEGGPGGEPFRVSCNDGHYLVGFAGRVGDWFDQIRTACALWSSKDSSFGQPGIGIPFGDSKGGVPVSTFCPGNTAVLEIEFGNTRTTGYAQDGFVDYLLLTCVSPLPPFTPASSRPRILSQGVSDDTLFLGKSLPYRHSSFCPYGEIAIGIRGRAGLFVDALGLVCAAAPPPPPYGQSESFDAGPSSTSKAAKELEKSTSVKRGMEFESSQAFVPTGPTPGTAQPDGGLKYAYPFIKDRNNQFRRLDYCRDPNQGCGQPAADQYCLNEHGRPFAMDYKLGPNAGKTAYIRTRNICAQDQCYGFEFVTCAK